MTRLLRPLALCALIMAEGTVQASAATLTVCPSGCVYHAIQIAINAASPGDTIAIGEGVYVENLVVDRSLTLRRRYAWSHPVILPAISAANPCAGSSLCGGAASNIILVQADNVTIDGLTLDGDNPNLTSGIVAGGVDLDARNGIITNHALGVFNNLTVANTTVRNVYLRGMYASSGGTFNFHDNIVQNVQADPASIAMFNFGGAGQFANNFVAKASDAISSNHSRGVQFLGNIVVQSASGIHTDNAGDGGGTADVIRWNSVLTCTSDGYGIWDFVPYLAPTVKDNVVLGCAIGLAAFGQGGAVTSTFSGNIVNGIGAKTSTPSSSLGVVVSTDILGYGSTDVNASFTGNVISGFATGVYVEEGCQLFGSYFPTDCAVPGNATATLHSNIIAGNQTGANGLAGTAVDAEYNWWGSSKGLS